LSGVLAFINSLQSDGSGCYWQGHDLPAFDQGDVAGADHRGYRWVDFLDLLGQTDLAFGEFGFFGYPLSAVFLEQRLG